jgi:lipopolysaccharide assembly outer membrane protein LptD (OstA)
MPLQNFTRRVHIFAGWRLHSLRCASIMRLTMRVRFTFSALFLLCSAAAVAAGGSRPETFVIQASRDGSEATIKIPVGAVSAFSANRAEALNYGDSRVEAMRLRGNVRIEVIGTSQPIRIRADHVVLELTADEAPHWLNLFRPARKLRSTEIIVDANDTQTFVGNVSFTVPTSAGSMQITADRVEHSAGAAARTP